MKENELHERVEKAEKNWQMVTHGMPGDEGWGFFSYSDAPAAVGGGIGTFVWLHSRDELLSFIAETLPFSPPGPCHVDPFEIANRVKAAVSEMKALSTNDEDGVRKLNQILKSFSQIKWIGTPRDLLQGNHPYAQHVRAAFRDTSESEIREGELPDSPISENEKEAFYLFLNDWGL